MHKMKFGGSRPRRRIVPAMLSVLGAVALSATACSSSTHTASDSGGSSGSSTSTGGGTNSGAPVPIMMVAPLTGANGVYQPWVDAVKGTVAAINAQGGAGGHQLALTVCDAGESANTELACGQQAVQQKDVGVINMMSATGPLGQYLDPAGIPRFGVMVDPTDKTDPLSFSVADAGGVSQQGTVALGAKLGCKSIVLVREDPGTAAEVAQTHNDFIAAGKVTGITADEIEMPPTATDASSYISKALSSHPDCLVVEGYGAPEVALMESASQMAGPSVKLMTQASFLSATAIKSLGSIVDRVSVAVAAWPVSSAGSGNELDQFKSDITQYAPSPNALDSNSEIMWASTKALSKAISEVKGDVTAAKVVAALHTFVNYPTGINSTVSYGHDMSPPVPPRDFAPYFIQTKYVSGIPQAVGGFYNEYTGQPAP